MMSITTRLFIRLPAMLAVAALSVASFAAYAADVSGTGNDADARMQAVLKRNDNSQEQATQQKAVEDAVKAQREKDNAALAQQMKNGTVATSAASAGQ